MQTMIFKMTTIITLYVLLTILIWKRTTGKTLTWPVRICIGLIYGVCAILSTHFGVDYSHMMLNVRDMGPLSAGLFFDPVSGIIAGLIGGIERYIAGTYWGVGSYTRIACSVSTCLAGFVAAGMNIYIFKRKKPSPVYAFFMGAVMEVFHMYVVFITHRGDMNMAFYVVKICAPPMIFFTGLGMAVSATALKICAGEWKNPFRKISDDEIPVSQKFQFWLFAVTISILCMNLLFMFSVQTQTAIQNADDELTATSGDIHQTYDKLEQTGYNTDALAEATALMEARSTAEAITHAGGFRENDFAFLNRIRNIENLVSVATVDENGNAVAVSGEKKIYTGLLSDVLEGKVNSRTAMPTRSLVVAGARCTGGMIQVVIDRDTIASALNLTNLNEALLSFHVGSEGSFDIVRSDGTIVEGNHKGGNLSIDEVISLLGEEEGTSFRSELFGKESLIRYEKLDYDLILLTQIPMEEVYADRDQQAYESAFAAIILFAVIYILISSLVQRIVVNNLQLVNESLGRITKGDLNEVVSVRNSSEFASLSNDINQTVSVLKGYIEAAEKRIEQELEFARTIQESALPNNFKFPRNDFELYATMDPAREVGGDFYDFFFIDKNKLALVIADVSGKGIPAALFMMRAKTAIRGLAESGETPAEILYRANNTLCEGNDAEMFVSVWLGIIDLLTGKMQCANAGHEYPVLTKDGEYYMFKDKHGLVLAAMEGMRFKEYELQLEPGEKLFVYTDGIPEAININEEQYGSERLLDALNRVKNETMEVTLPAVRQDIAGFVGEADQFDDITMLGLTYFGSDKEC